MGRITRSGRHLNAQNPFADLTCGLTDSRFIDIL